MTPPSIRGSFGSDSVASTRSRHLPALLAQSYRRATTRRISECPTSAARVDSPQILRRVRYEAWRRPMT
jgi:hypothetical protein